MGITLDEWTDLLRREYLEEFVASGGAAVKIAVAPRPAAPAIIDAVADQAAAQGYVVARIDAGRTRIHMVDQLFHAVARQIDWDALTERWLRRLFHENGIEVASDRPLQEMDAIAEANGRLKPDLFREVNSLITNAILRNYSMSREFRTAVALLCFGYINPQSVSPTDSELIHKWLCGEKGSLTALKRLQIYQRISRHNARLLLGSLAMWVHEVGGAGLALLIDMNAVVSPAASLDTPVRYTRATVLDTYEVLRQFIDETDEAQHLLLVAVAGPGLLEDPKRSVDNYDALKLRIADEVRDRDRANPLNTMVRLEVALGGEETA